MCRGLFSYSLLFNFALPFCHLSPLLFYIVDPRNPTILAHIPSFQTTRLHPIYIYVLPLIFRRNYFRYSRTGPRPYRLDKCDFFLLQFYIICMP